LYAGSLFQAPNIYVDPLSFSGHLPSLWRVFKWHDGIYQIFLTLIWLVACICDASRKVTGTIAKVSIHMQLLLDELLHGKINVCSQHAQLDERIGSLGA
jgi:hypothetical protein